MIKKRKLNVLQQAAGLKRDYGFGEIETKGNDELVWVGTLRSSPIGSEYLVKVSYKKGGVPEVFILKPEILDLPEGEVRLMHVYNHAKQKLCLYYPRANEWNSTKSISSTIIPWAIEWLYHYETWLITGQWTGGGIHLSDSSKHTNSRK